MKQKLFFRLFIFLWVVVGSNAWSQVNVSYPTSSNYPINQAISPLVPNQSGGTISGGTYTQVNNFAGTGVAAGTTVNSETNGAALSATFRDPRGMVKDALGNYYVTEITGKRIRKISSTGIVSTVYQFSSFEPRDLAINTSNGDLYVIIGTHRLIKLPNINSANYLSQDPVYTYTNDATNVIAGSSTSGSTDATGTSAKFNDPWGIAMAPDNSYLLIADYGNDKIRKVILSNMAVSTYFSTSLSGPIDVHIVNDNLIYVPEFDADQVSKIVNGNTITLFASGAYTNGNFDGTGAAAYIDEPHQLTADALGNIYVVERYNHKVRKITPDGKVITIAGGLWDNAYNGDAIGNNINARFNYPAGILYDASGGFLLVADRGNNRLKKIQLEGFQIIPEPVAGISFDTATGAFSGTPTTYTLKNHYIQSFNNSTLGSVNGTAVTVSGNASVIGEYLMLTERNNNKQGGITIPASGFNEAPLYVSFDAISTKTSGAADGFSYSFGPDVNVASTSPNAEVGTGTKLTVSFSNFSGNSRGIRIYYNPASNQSLTTTVGSVMLAYSSNLTWMGTRSKVAINVDNSGKLTLTLNGTVIFNNVQLPADYLTSNKATWKHVFKARTGADNDLMAIDNLAILHGYGPTDHTIIARDYEIDQVITTANINTYDLPTIATQNVSGVQAYQATVAFQMVAIGTSTIQESGVVFSTNATPTISDDKIVNSTNAIGTYSLDITGLSHGTTYYARAYATNEYGVTVYGQVVSFTTLTTPTVATSTISSITQTSAISGGNVSSDGGLSIIEKGICWSTTANPTINDNKVASNYTATGSFISELTELNSSTTYYVRAYATNSIGTVYGDEVNFTTKIQAPNIYYNASNIFTLNTAITPLQVTNTGGDIPMGTPAMVSTFAGSGGYGGADGSALSAEFSSPEYIVIDSQGNKFISEGPAHRIRKITVDGIVSTFAGGTQGNLDGTGTAAKFNYPNSMAIDADDNIYVCDYSNNKIKKITPAGVVTTFISLDSPHSIAIDTSGNLFVVQSWENKVLKITPSGSVTTFIGGTQGTNDGTGTAAQLNYPGKIIIAPNGDFYVSESYRIRKVTVDGVVTTFVGGTTYGSVDGTGIEARFNGLNDLALDANGNLFVSDYSKIRKVSPEGVVSTYSGSIYGFADGDVASAQFKSIYGLAIDGDGNLIALDRHDGRIRKITPGFISYTVSPSLPLGLSLS
ncbi:MAG: hypothetical protein ACOVOV_07840, partial [Dolichospermum sp.]